MTASLYIAVMNTNQDNGEPTQGVELPDLKTIEKWSLRDLNACIAFLSAIRDDVELRSQLAQWFHGRIVNAKNKQENPHPNFGK